MPRTGGVYSPPAGTKGVSNTTIQSVPYNAWVDDLTSDANAARPITAGGTGATSASAARTALGVEIGTNVQAYDAGLASIAGLTTAANQMIYTTASDAYATTALTAFGRSILDDANASAVLTTLGVSGFVQSILDETSAAAFLAAIGGAGLSGATFTGNISISRVDPFIQFNETDTAKNWFIVANGGVLTISENSTGNTRVILNPSGGDLTLDGNKVWTAGNDGAGSGLDADLLDGQSSAYYTAIVARLGFTPPRQGGSNNITFTWNGTALELMIDATPFGTTFPISVSGSAAQVGGVALAGLAQLYTGSTDTATFPVGHSVMMLSAPATNRNQTATVYLSLGGAQDYTGNVADSAGTLAGTWRARGRAATAVLLMQRVG
ncbi:hypothetical protein [Ensifer canadensis]|uniref:hypothetical protein n=1 Tax=Ensifer canadensis TaxID=555315 RepID=UPI0035E3F437